MVALCPGRMRDSGGVESTEDGSLVCRLPGHKVRETGSP